MGVLGNRTPGLWPNVRLRGNIDLTQCTPEGKTEVCVHNDQNIKFYADCVNTHAWKRDKDGRKMLCWLDILKYLIKAEFNEYICPSVIKPNIVK